jgi:drug/metabolite transporter (DMT)-like permease
MHIYPMNAVTNSNATYTATSAKIILAFVVIYFVWGTTFMAIKFSIEALPPFTSGSVRMILAAAIMYCWLRWNNSKPLAGVNWSFAALCGALMVGVGNGLVVWAQQGVPSGIAALLVATVPAVVLLFNWFMFARIAPSWIALLGMILAMGGLTVVVANTRSLSGHITSMHLIALMVSVVAWSIGTLLQRSTTLTSTLAAFTCAQLLFGGLTQLLLAAINTEWRDFDLHKFTPLTGIAVFYLVVFGSVVSFNCYLWLLQHVPTQRVATYAVVNPIVALILGALFLDEQLSIKIWMVVVVVLVGVGIVLFEEKLLGRLARSCSLSVINKAN